MKTQKIFWLAAVVMVLTKSGGQAAVDPRTNSWFTSFSGKYARIYTSDANKASGTSATTWSNGSQNQANPAYCGVQEVYASSNYVYVRSTGLGGHVLGPWYLNAAHTTSFPNYPTNQKALWRFPRVPGVAATNAFTSLGTIGFFVDGVAMFDTSDGYVWTGSSESGNGTGYWHREAYANEGVTFDPGYAHQEQTGVHHYHANAPALRYFLGDHVDYNATTKVYSESTNAVTKHSPILGWVRDGYPVYGPYGYSNAASAGSPIIRMRSGFQLRNGSNGTDNITNVNRANLPAWAQRLYGTNSAGPGVSTSYPAGRYMEDYAFLADLTNSATGTNYRQGVEFDLDEHNGRWCVTPEFPGGTYAYFVSMDSNGVPKYPNNIGRTYYGNPIGGSVSSIGEPVVTNFLGGANLAAALAAPAVANGLLTLTWSAVEGGTYQVESTTNFSTWTTNAANISPSQTSATYSYSPAGGANFYRVRRTATAAFDSAGTTAFNSGGYGIAGISPAGTNANRTFTLTINLDSGANPPPQTAPINSVTLGSYTGSGNTHVSQTQVTSTITIPNGAASGPQTVVVVFPGPPANPTAVVTYSLTNGFTIY